MLTVSSEQVECNRAEAVALETVYGILAHPYAYYVERPGKAGETWVVRERTEEARTILHLARLPESDPESPRVKSPEHPFLTCLYAQEAHRALLKWSEDPSIVPAFQKTNGKLCRLQWDDRGTLIYTAAGLILSVFNVPDLRHAAALIVCGFRPVPRWKQLPGSPPAVSLAGASLTFHEIHREAFRAAAINSRRNGPLGIDASKIVLGSQAPGEHPWCYAIQALANAAAAKTAQHEARKNPVLMQRGVGQRSAIVSASLMQQGNRESQSLRDSVGLHLEGVS